MKTFGKTKYVLLGVLMTLVCVCSAFIMTGCKEKKIGEIESFPVLSDIRGTEEEMATITDGLNRQVTYNKNAKKIIALSWESDIIGLGIKPLAVGENCEILADLYSSFFTGIEFVSTAPVNYEEVMSYHPDLIITTLQTNWISGLEQIAPTIAVDYDEQDYSVRLNRLGEIFGVQDNAKKLIDYSVEIKETAAKKAKQMKLKDKTVTIFGSLTSIMIANGVTGMKYDTILFDEFGMKKTQAVEDYLAEIESSGNSLFGGINSEAVPNYEADYTIYCDMMQLGEIPPTVQTDPGWMSLKAVQENKVGIIDGIFFGQKDLMCLAGQYNQLFDALEIAIGTEK